MARQGHTKSDKSFKRLRIENQIMNIQHYTYCVARAAEDGEHVGLCTEFASLCWLVKTPDAALKSIQKVVGDVISDMQANGEPIPTALAEKHHCFLVDNWPINIGN